MSPSHPLGYHRRRVPDRVVFERVVAAPAHLAAFRPGTGTALRWDALIVDSSSARKSRIACRSCWHAVTPWT